MIRKILDGLTVVSFLLSVSVVGSGVFGYLYITNKENQEKLKQQLVEQVTGSLKMPGLSGPVLPTAKPKAAGNAALSSPKF
tara:strand:- start:658 stop:900 length:243 start_codon:yes stop_codon:yes gene_type:complete